MAYLQQCESCIQLYLEQPQLHIKHTFFTPFLPKFSLQFQDFEMQSKSPSFFEISINTEKFSQFTTSLNQILATHEKQLQAHTRELAQLRAATDEKMSRVRSECEYEFEQLERKRKEEAQHTATFHNDLTVKYEFLANEHRNRLANLQEQLQALQVQVEGQETTIKDKVVQEVEDEVQHLVLSSKAYMEREMQNVAKKIKEMEISTASHDSLMRNIINAYEHHRANNSDDPNPREPRPTDVLRYASPDKPLSLEQLTVKEGRERKRRKMQEKCQQENLQYASISAKLDLLQTRLTAKQNESIDKVVYPKKHPQYLSSEGSDANINLSLGRIEAQRRSLEEKISMKLQSIEAIIRENFQRLDQTMTREANAQALLRDELEITSRKLQKEKGRVSDIAGQVKRLEERRVDEKLIENMVSMFKRQQRALEDELEKKLSTEGFTREKQRLGERIQVVTESLSEKADKEEIKRAFQFVEDKMKEIIMIIADDIHHEKEGAAKRLPFKCLSCDKDLESSLPTTLRHNSDKKPLRPPTSQIRKKLRVPHNEDRV